MAGCCMLEDEHIRQPPVFTAAESGGIVLVTEEQVKAALKTVKDPEIPINLVDLGLIYKVELDDDVVHVDMTLTTMGCPVAGEIVQMAKMAVESVEGVKEAHVNLVWSPPWNADRMSDRAKRALGRA